MSNPFGVMTLESLMANSKDLIRYQPAEGIRSNNDSHMVELCFGPSGQELSARSRSSGESSAAGGGSRLSTAGRIPQQRLPGWLGESCRDSFSHCSLTLDSSDSGSKDNTGDHFHTSQIMGRSFDRGRSICVGGRTLTAGRVPQQRLPGWLSETCTEKSSSSQNGSQKFDSPIPSCEDMQKFPTLLARSKQPRDYFEDKDGMCSNLGGLHLSLHAKNLERDTIELKRNARSPAVPELPNLEASKAPVEQGRTAGEMIFGHDFRKSFKAAHHTGPKTSRRSASSTSGSCHSARLSSTRASSCSTGRRSELSRLYSPTSDLLKDNCLLPWKL